MTDDLTDRDRLALAFDELRTNGYIADVSLSYRTCCRDCALHAIAMAADERDEDGDLVLPDKFVFWHMVKDDFSFVDSTQGFPMPKEFHDKGEDWFEDQSNVLVVEAAMTSERVSNYVWLVNPLNLHWNGNADEIVAALRRQGLSADVPNNDHWCIEVMPTRPREWVVEQMKEEQSA